MQPHEQRVVDERNELGEKLIKLRAFLGGDLFSSLSINDQVLLTRQEAAMDEYLSILT